MTSAFRLSPQQESLLAVGGAGGVSQITVSIDGDLDVTALRRALGELARRHEILRTTFVSPPGMRVKQQAIHDRLEPGWVHENADPDDPAARPGGDGAESPPLRARLRQTAPAGHELTLSLPSTLGDGASLLVVMQELAWFYGAQARPELSEDPVQYADYAEWRHQLVTDSALASEPGRAFWRELAAAPTTALELGFARPAEGSSLATAQVALALDGSVREAVSAAAASARVGEETVLEAAWHALLARMSGAQELRVAGLSDGRGQPDLARAGGAFAEWAPIVTRTEAQTTLAEIIDQVARGRGQAARWHDHAVASDLAGVANSASAGFAYTRVAELAPFGASAVRLAALRAPMAGPWLVCALIATPEGLTGELQYDPACLDGSDAAELAARLVTLLGGCGDPHQLVAELPILIPGERERLIAAAASPDRLGAPDLFCDAFEAHAAGHPDRPAVISDSDALTYAELDVLANRIGHELRAAGVGPDATVGLCLPRSVTLIAAILGVLKAGGAYVPLNDEHPVARLDHQLRESGARALLTTAELVGRLPSFSGVTICPDRDAEAIAARPATTPGTDAGPDHLAYVIYTSGSTGTPKGVGVTHGNLANYCAAVGVRLGLHDGEGGDGLRAAHISSIATDLGNTCLFPILAAGGCVQIISEAGIMDADALLAQTSAQPPDVLKITPSHLRALLRAGGPGVLPRRTLVLGGEALPWDLVAEVRTQAPGLAVINHYGPTETTIGSCTMAVPAQADRSRAATVPIGTPMANSQAHILDARHQPVPAGVAGELYIGGAGVARGYVDNEEETAARFIADPFAAQPGARLYRTGDRVRRLRDGVIEFLGRVDQQLKLRGYRVEPGEIEAVLAGHPAVRQAAVVAPTDERGERQLVAYLVASPMPPAAELRDVLAQTLPEYMVPARFVSLDRLPLTPSGKTDRRELEGRGMDTAVASETYVAPRDALEHEIAEIWRELLGVPRVGVLDDFFALGGHSLLATQAIMRVRRAHGNIPLHALLGAPTVAALAEVVRGSSIELAS